jgi:streptogramin lyase
MAMNDRDDLAEQLADLIDNAAPPVAFEELVDRAESAVGGGTGFTRGRRVVLVATVLVLVIATVVVVARRDRSSSVTLRPTTTTTTTPAPTTAPSRGDPVAKLPRLPLLAVRRFDLPADLRVPQAVFAGGSLWLAAYRSSMCSADCPGVVLRLDPATGRVNPVPAAVPFAPLGIASDGNALWVLSDTPNGSPYQVTRVDLPSGRVRFTVPVPRTHVYGNTNPIARIAAGFGSVWVYEGDEFIARLDPETGAQVAKIELPPNRGANGLALNSQGVWVVAWGDTTIMRVDPDTNTASVVARFPGGFAQSIAVDDDYVWTTHFTSVLDLVRINTSDPSSRTNAHIPTADVAAGDGEVWFLGWETGKLAASPRNHYGLVGQIDPVTLKVLHVADLPVSPNDDSTLVVADHAAWVIDSTRATVWRVEGT